MDFLTNSMQSWLVQYDSKKDRYSRIGLFEWPPIKLRKNRKVQGLPRFLERVDIETNKTIFQSVYFHEESPTELHVFITSIGHPFGSTKSVYRYLLDDGQWVKEEEAMLSYIS